MAKAYLFYNPLAGGGQILEDLEALEFVLDEETVLCDMTKPETYAQTLFGMNREDYFVVCGGEAEERSRNIDFEAQVQNEKPFIFSAFPSGAGETPKQMILLSDRSVLVSAMYFDAGKNGYVVRLWNTQNKENQVCVTLPLWGTEQEIKLGAFQFKTYLIDEQGTLKETTVL
jgi:hypothetical protein